MGSIAYAGSAFEFEDRLLTHLHVVITQKFRRGESFPMSWIEVRPSGERRNCIWLTPSEPIFFKFSGSRVPQIDHAWIGRLKSSADSPRGLIVVNADGSPAHGPAIAGTTERARRAVFA
jgi:hypothetical protein